VILGGLVLLGLLDVQFQILDVLLQARDLLVGLLLLLEQLVAGILLLSQALLDILFKIENVIGGGG